MNLEFRVFDKDTQQFIELGGDTFIAYDGKLKAFVGDENYGYELKNVDVLCSVSGTEFEPVTTERICKNCESCVFFETGNPVFVECRSKRVTEEEKEKNIIATNENGEIDLDCKAWKYNGF